MTIHECLSSLSFAACVIDGVALAVLYFWCQVEGAWPSWVEGRLRTRLRYRDGESTRLSRALAGEHGWDPDSLIDWWGARHAVALWFIHDLAADRFANAPENMVVLAEVVKVLLYIVPVLMVAQALMCPFT